MNEPNAFGALLSALRHARRLSQPQLAEWADVSHSAISRLESGQRHPSTEMIRRLAAAMELTDPERDRLLIAAGFAATNPAAAVADPDVRAIHALLDDEAAPLSYRLMCRGVLRSLIAGKPPAMPAIHPEAV